MKKVLLGTTALIAIAAMAAPATAAERIKLSVSGYGNFALGYVDQDLPAGESLRDIGWAQESEVHFAGKTTLDNGVVVGFRAELELDRDETSGSVGAADLVDEVYFTITTGFGEFQAGSQDGIADQFLVEPPMVSKTSNRATRIDDSEIYFFQDPVSGGAFRPVTLRSDVSTSDDFLKIIYMTPRLAGFQAGISYMPEPTKGFSGFADRRDDETNEQGDIIELGLNFRNKWGSTGVKAYAAYLTGNNEAPGTVGDGVLFGTADDLEEWGAGLSFEFDLSGWTLEVGGAYRNTNTSNFNSTSLVDDDIDSELYSLGIVLGTGPWQFGGGYITGETQVLNTGLVPDDFEDREGTAWELNVGYAMGPRINWTLGYQNWEYEQDAGLANFYNGLDEASADVIYLEFAFST